MRSVFVVFGGAGFVGRALISQLQAAGKPAIVVDRKVPVAPFQGDACLEVDVSDPKQVASLADHLPGGAVFVNLAARQYHPDVPRTERQAWFNAVNLSDAIQVADLAVRKRAAGLVQFSSDMVYGTARNVPVMESHPCRPNGEYGRSKQLMEAALAKKAALTGLKLTIFRPCRVAGAQEPVSGRALQPGFEAREHGQAIAARPRAARRLPFAGPAGAGQGAARRARLAGEPA